MKNASQLEWGLKHTDIQAPALWGARTIYYTGRIPDILWDRCDFIAETDEDKETLKRALNGGAFKQFLEWAPSHFNQSEAGRKVVTFDKVCFYADTNASCGYLYVTAHLKEDE